MMRGIVVCILISLLTSVNTHANEVFTVHHDYGDLSKYKPHPNVLYEVNLLKLVLEKTKHDHGRYELKGVDKEGINHVKAMELMARNSIPNYVKVFGFSEYHQDKHRLDYATFPVYLGLLSYRTCFTAPENINKFKSLKKRRQFSKLIHATGVGWTDAKILRANGIKVKEVDNRDAIYSMIENRDVDLFCRGTNEALEDYMGNISNATFLYDRNFAIYYPNPHLFHTHDSNQKLIERLEAGLLRAYEDGSMVALWRDSFMESVDFIQLEKRHLFELHNPLIERLTFDFQKYDFWQIPEDGRRYIYSKANK